ncbi:MAG TPA: hypothetical protein VK540_12185 [Polyangiaceae bacterium]|jgi:hypothetical protein|nr:hypothetical protein [Polyangiaceae bacterium]
MFVAAIPHQRDEVAREPCRVGRFGQYRRRNAGVFADFHQPDIVEGRDPLRVRQALHDLDVACGSRIDVAANHDFAAARWEEREAMRGGEHHTRCDDRAGAHRRRKRAASQR